MGITARKFKVGIIGCGAIFPMHAQSLSVLENTEIKAVCDIKEDRANAAAHMYGCDFYTNYKEMIDNADIDCVHICTPHYLHSPMAIYAANAKKHVMTEKPMSIDYNDALEMVRAAKDNCITLGVIFQNHYNPGSVLVKKTLESGELGKILSGRAVVTWSRGGRYYSESDWRGTWEKEGGGVLINQAIHTLDLLRLFADDEIDYVDASLFNRVNKSIEVEDSAEGVVAYKNGLITCFFCCNYNPVNSPVEIELCCENGSARILGDKGIVSFNDGRELISEQDPNEAVEYGLGAKSYWGVNHIKQIKEFYDSLANGRQPELTGEYALKTQEMICAIYRSGKTNSRVYF